MLRTSYWLWRVWQSSERWDRTSPWKWHLDILKKARYTDRRGQTSKGTISTLVREHLRCLVPRCYRGIRGRRECLTDNFPCDSLGNLDKAILGSNCVLDLTSVENICRNLKVFFQWSTENCRAGDRRIATLKKRCDKIDEIRRNISQNL